MAALASVSSLCAILDKPFSDALATSSAFSILFIYFNSTLIGSCFAKYSLINFSAFSLLIFVFFNNVYTYMTIYNNYSIVLLH